MDTTDTQQHGNGSEQFDALPDLFRARAADLEPLDELRLLLSHIRAASDLISDNADSDALRAASICSVARRIVADAGRAIELLQAPELSGRNERAEIDRAIWARFVELQDANEKLPLEEVTRALERKQWVVIDGRNGNFATHYNHWTRGGLDLLLAMEELILSIDPESSPKSD